MMNIYEYLNYILTCIIVTYKFILYIIHKIAKKKVALIDVLIF